MAVDNTARGLALKSRVVAMSGVAVPHTGDTNTADLATISLPVMGPNDQLEIIVDYGHTGTAGTFTPTVKLGATTIMGGSAVSATNLSTRGIQIVANKGATNSQGFMNAAYAFATAFGHSTSAYASGSEETNAGATLKFQGAVANSADTVTLVRYRVIHHKA